MLENSQENATIAVCGPSPPDYGPHTNLDSAEANIIRKAWCRKYGYLKERGKWYTSYGGPYEDLNSDDAVEARRQFARRYGANDLTYPMLHHHSTPIIHGANDRDSRNGDLVMTKVGYLKL